MYFWNALGKQALTFPDPALFNCWISDMETCYKVMRTEIMRDLALRATTSGSTRDNREGAEAWAPVYEGSGELSRAHVRRR